jgi:hypothetical protein
VLTIKLRFFSPITLSEFLLYNQKDAPVSEIIYSCKKLYMFRTVFPSIIRSSKLHIQQQACVNQLLLLAASGRQQQMFDMLVTVCAVLSSWRWTKRPPETCRAFYKNKQLQKQVRRFGCTIRLYNDVRTNESQTLSDVSVKRQNCWLSLQGHTTWF